MEQRLHALGSEVQTPGDRHDGFHVLHARLRLVIAPERIGGEQAVFERHVFPEA